MIFSTWQMVLLIIATEFFVSLFLSTLLDTIKTSIIIRNYIKALLANKVPYDSNYFSTINKDKSENNDINKGE